MASHANETPYYDLNSRENKERKDRKRSTSALRPMPSYRRRDRFYVFPSLVPSLKPVIVGWTGATFKERRG